jgi:GMP synthase (glutamine-hydrolysing)
MSATKPIVVVKAGDALPNVLEKRGDFDAMIPARTGEVWTGAWTMFDCRKERGPDPKSAAGFIITGSSSMVSTREPWMLETEAWLRDVVASGTPTLGICFGHQLLAQALGGQVRRNPEGREIGTIRIERLADDPIFDDVPLAFDANATHVETVVELPPGAVVLARSSKDRHQTLRFAPKVYGTQFHPEIDGEIMCMYLEARSALLADEGMSADAIAREVHDATASTAILKNFVRRAVLG